MANQIERSFEVMVLEGERWNLMQVLDSLGDAMAAAQELQRRPTSKGVRVVRETFDPSTGLSHGKIVFEQTREGQQKARATIR